MRSAFAAELVAAHVVDGVSIMLAVTASSMLLLQ